MADRPTGRLGGTLLDLLLINREKLVKNAKVEGNFDDNNHQMLKFKILRERRKRSIRIKTLDLRKAGYNKLRDLVGRFSWEASMKGKGIQKT